MSDVVVGMRLRSTLEGGPQCDVVVTELTARGFKYDLDIVEESVPFIPRWGMTMNKRGHEHYGVDGEAQYEEVK
jgi:hypothetical protein